MRESTTIVKQPVGNNVGKSVPGPKDTFKLSASDKTAAPVKDANSQAAGKKKLLGKCMDAKGGLKKKELKKLLAAHPEISLGDLKTILGAKIFMNLLASDPDIFSGLASGEDLGSASNAALEDFYGLGSGSASLANGLLYNADYDLFSSGLPQEVVIRETGGFAAAAPQLGTLALQYKSSHYAESTINSPTVDLKPPSNKANIKRHEAELASVAQSSRDYAHDATNIKSSFARSERPKEINVRAAEITYSFNATTGGQAISGFRQDDPVSVAKDRHDNQIPVGVVAVTAQPGTWSDASQQAFNSRTASGQISGSVNNASGLRGDSGGGNGGGGRNSSWQYRSPLIITAADFQTNLNTSS